MGIIVDSREKGEFISVLKAKGLSFITEQLQTGDYICFNDENPDIRVVVERKRLDDLFSSYFDGRLPDQFERLSHEKFAVLIITGNLKETMARIPVKISPHIIQEIVSLAVVQYNFRSIVWLIDGVDDAKHFGFLSAIKILEGVINGHLDEIPQKHTKLAKDVRVNALMQLLNLDMRTCKRLLTKYGSVPAVLALTDDQFLSIKGIGPAKLQLIRYILNTNVNNQEIQHAPSENCTKCGNQLDIIKTSAGNLKICKHCIGSLL